MANRLGPIEICCDAPAYAVVHACERVGFHSPLDVRWCHLRHRLTDEADGLAVQKWKEFLGMGRPNTEGCRCGQALPVLHWYTFTFTTGREENYRVGQCSRCRTIFWEEA